MLESENARLKTELKAVRCVPPAVAGTFSVHATLLAVSGAVKVPCAPLSRAMCGQLVAETAEERFDERRVLLLKGQIIQLERQVSAGSVLVVARALRAGRQDREASRTLCPTHE